MTKRMRDDDTYRVPVTVLTGFLGSGKTTLLNHILTAEHGRRIAVIENEFGSVGVDDSLVKHRISADEEIFAMNNGCLCCTVRGDLIKIISKLLKDHGSRFEHILIETTGMADPAPIAQTFLAEDSTVADKTRIDAIICLVDAKHLLKQLDYPRTLGTVNESVQQLAFADRIILNKTDLVTAAHLEAVKQRIKSINAFAPILATTHAKVEMSDILHVEAFSVERALQIDPHLLEVVEDHHHPHTHGHKHGHEHGHGHHHKHESRHDGGVGSVGLQFAGDINMAKLENFLASLIELDEENLYRYKGVLSVKGMNNKYVVQGVHGTYDAEFSDPWGYTEPRDNKFVFIGRHLDRDNLTKGLTACRITTDSLRFPIGSPVIARVCHGWVEGVIVATWDEGHPYRVRVLGPEAADFHSAEIWAPEDDDSYIRLSGRRTSPAVQLA